jgi:hypothetical protein
METPNLIESYQPCSGNYSLRKDLRLNAWLAVAAVSYQLVLWWLKHHPDLSPLTQGLLRLVPLIPALLYVRAWMRVVRGLDELQRRIQLEAFLFAALGTVIFGVVIATLNASGVGLPDLGDLRHGLGLGGAFFVMFPLWLVGWAIASCRYT